MNNNNNTTTTGIPYSQPISAIPAHLLSQQAYASPPSTSPARMESPSQQGMGRQIPLTCAGHTRPVVQLQFSRILDDGNYLLISACKDGNPMLRIGNTGDWIGTFQGHKGAVWCARLNEDASRAVTASADFTVKVWDTYSGTALHTFPHKHVVRAVDISPDGRWVVTGGNEKIVRVYDTEKPNEKPKESKPHSAAVRTVLWDEWRQIILSAAEEKAVKVWSCDGLELKHTMETLDPVANLTLSDDGEVIQAAAGKSVYFWSAQTYELACRIDTKYDLSCVALHPYRDRFICGSRSELWVRVFSFPEGEELEVYKGHHGPVHTVAYSPDGMIYASGSEDGTIRLWQTIPGTEYGLWKTQEEEIAQYDEAMLAALLQEGALAEYGADAGIIQAMLNGMMSPEEYELLRLQAAEEARRQHALAMQQQLQPAEPEPVRAAEPMPPPQPKGYAAVAAAAAATPAPQEKYQPPRGRYQPPGRRNIAPAVYQ